MNKALAMGMALTLALVVSAPARADDAIEARVDTMLSNVERPTEADAWRELGAEAIPVLIAIADDEGALRSRRLQAIGALGAFGNPLVGAYLAAVAERSGDSPSFRRAALDSLGSSQGRAAVPTLEAAMTDGDESVREVAIRALGRIDDPEATSALEAWRAEEVDKRLEQLDRDSRR